MSLSFPSTIRKLAVFIDSMPKDGARQSQRPDSEPLNAAAMVMALDRHSIPSTKVFFGIYEMSDSQKHSLPKAFYAFAKCVKDGAVFDVRPASGPSGVSVALGFSITDNLARKDVHFFRFDRSRSTDGNLRIVSSTVEKKEALELIRNSARIVNNAQKLSKIYQDLKNGAMREAACAPEQSPHESVVDAADHKSLPRRL